MTRPTRVVLGEVVGAHGLDGRVRVRLFGEGPENLLRARRLALGGGPDDPAAREVEVEQAEPGRRGEIRLRLSGIRSREAAGALGGLLVLGDPARIEPLPEGEHYWFELVGCAVEGQDGGVIGTVRAIWETGAHDVLVVETAEGREVLLPAARELLKEVDAEGRRIVIEVPPGLLDP